MKLSIDDRQCLIPFEFNSLRSDWYASNQSLPRYVRQTIIGKKCFEFLNFPRQWLPVFEWFEVPWRGSISPINYLPIYSELVEIEILAVIKRARNEGLLRTLVESTSHLDPIISDFLYILDNSLDIIDELVKKEIHEFGLEKPKRKTILLNGWQSYGRQSVRVIETLVKNISTNKKICATLPCSLVRPYNKSRTHKSIYRILEEEGYIINDIHKVVITSLGVLPEEIWELPQVIRYDAGVPDIYRTLRMVRSFFKLADYDCVLDCLQFPPYSDILEIVNREGIIREIIKIPIPHKRHYIIRD
jgi:hypothetical protein